MQMKHLRETLYSVLLFQDISFFDREAVGDLTSRLGADCQRLSLVIANDISLILRNVLQGIGALINLLILSRSLALSTLYQKKAAKLVQEFTAGANEAAQETFSLMRTVRVYGTERKEFGRFKQWLVKVAFVNIRESVAYGFWCVSFSTLYRSTQIIAVVLGGISIMSGHVSAEQLSILALWYKLHNDLASTLEQRAILENEMLHRQDEELRCLFPQTDHAVPSYLEYYPLEKEKSLVNHGVTNPDLVSNFAFENGDSDITLHLGVSTSLKVILNSNLMDTTIVIHPYISMN
ncbi:unnamed protein product [Prunus brigantina]